MRSGGQLWVSYPSGGVHDNPYGPCRCGATHNYERDYRDTLVF